MPPDSRLRDSRLTLPKGSRSPPRLRLAQGSPCPPGSQEVARVPGGQGLVASLLRCGNVRATPVSAALQGRQARVPRYPEAEDMGRGRGSLRSCEKRCSYIYCTLGLHIQLNTHPKSKHLAPIPYYLSPPFTCVPAHLYCIPARPHAHPTPAVPTA